MEADSPVTIVVVNFNSGGYLQRCIESLLCSDTRLDIVVVDNASSDQSLQTLKDVTGGAHRLQVIKNEVNLGFSTAVNIGAKVAAGSYMLVLNPDCQVHSHTVSRLAAVLDEYQNAGLAGALVFNEDGTEQRGCRRNDPTIARSIITTLGLGRWIESVDMTGQPLPDCPVEVDAVSGSAMMFKLSCFNQIGGMDERYFLHCEDLDVCKRIRNAGYQVLFAPGVSLYHRQGGSGGIDDSGIEKLKHQGMMRYYVEHLGGNSGAGRLMARILVWGHYALSRLKRRLRIGESRNGAGPNNNSPVVMPVVNQNEKRDRIVISGANSDVGDFLLHSLQDSGREVIALYRDNPGKINANNIQWMSLSYFDVAPQDDRPTFCYWIHLAPVWTVDRFSGVLSGGFPQQVVALSSTSIDVKKTSEDAREITIVGRLRQGEQTLTAICQSHGASCVVLRPTMIYGGPRNRNINLVKTLIRWLRFFPLAGEGAGLRQPVHARDVANACIQVLDRMPQLPQIYCYSIAGAEVLSYLQMIRRVFESIGRRPRLIHLPSSVLGSVLIILGRIPGLKALSPELIKRMEHDQIFPNDDAIRDFGYDPGGFQP